MRRRIGLHQLLLQMSEGAVPPFVVSAAPPGCLYQHLEHHQCFSLPVDVMGANIASIIPAVVHDEVPVFFSVGGDDWRLEKP